MKFQWRKLSRKERTGKYKYVVTETYTHYCNLGEEHLYARGRDKNIYAIYNPVVRRLIIFKGYQWDGSTVALDLGSCKRASAVHDLGYQFMQLGKLDIFYRDCLDQMYRDMCIEDGMWVWHANFRYWVLKNFAGKWAKAKNGKV